MVFVEPSVGDQLAPAVAQFAQGLEKFLRPNRDFQVAMQKAVGANPQLAQQLADLEKRAPGSLDRLGFGDLGKAIASIPESAGGQIARESQGDIVATGKKKIELEGAQTGFDLGRLNDTIAFLTDPANADVKSDEILRRLTGQTKTQRDVAEAEAPAKIAAAKGEAKADEAALTELPDLKTVDFKKAAQQFIAGGMEGSVAAAMFNTPGARESFQAAIQNVIGEKQRALTEMISGMRGDNQEDNFKTQKAFQMYSASNAGSLTAWKEVLFGKGREQAEELRAKKPEDLTQDQKDLLSAADAEKQLTMMEKLRNSRTMSAAIGEGILRLRTSIAKGENESTQQLLLSGLNDALTAKSEILGTNITARVGKIPDVGKAEQGTFDFNGRGLYFVDTEGKRIDEGVLFADPSTGANATRTEALRAFAVLNGLTPQQRAAELEKMKTRRPEIYKEVSAMFQVKPDTTKKK